MITEKAFHASNLSFLHLKQKQTGHPPGNGQFAVVLSVRAVLCNNVWSGRSSLAAGANSGDQV